MFVQQATMYWTFERLLSQHQYLNADGVAKTTDDQLSKDFTKYVTDNKATLEKKDLYLLCNSGASGARAATALLKAAGYDLAKVHTIHWWCKK